MTKGSDGLKAAIFDLDGTLVDSMPYWRKHLAAYLEELGIPVPEDLEERVNKGSSFRLLFAEIREQDPSITMEAIIDEYHRRMAPEYLDKIILKDHVRRYLDHLREREMPMCIATATPRELFMPMIERLDLGGYFDFYITVPEIGIGKAEPDIYEYCARRFALANSDCAVFEDTVQAVRTAKGAGFYTIAIADETSAWAEMPIREAADLFIESYLELLPVGGGPRG